MHRPDTRPPAPMSRYDGTGRMTTAFCTYYERGRSGRGVLCDVRHHDGTWTPRVWLTYEVWTACGGTAGDRQHTPD